MSTLPPCTVGAAALSSGCASWQRRYTLLRFVFMMVSYSASLYSTVGLRMLVPTLLTRMLSPAPPKCARTASSSATRDSASLTSAALPATS